MNRVDALEAKREKLMSAAKAAKRANRTLGDTWGNQLSLELKRILQSVALCDKSIKRQSVVPISTILLIGYFFELVKNEGYV